MSDPASNAGPAPLKGSALALTAVALALGTFMQVLDSSIANLPIPTLAGHDAERLAGLDFFGGTDEGVPVVVAFGRGEVFGEEDFDQS